MILLCAMNQFSTTNNSRAIPAFAGTATTLLINQAPTTSAINRTATLSSSQGIPSGQALQLQ